MCEAPFNPASALPRQIEVWGAVQVNGPTGLFTFEGFAAGIRPTLTIPNVHLGSDR